jgi:hypothetical protein
MPLVLTIFLAASTTSFNLKSLPEVAMVTPTLLPVDLAVACVLGKYAVTAVWAGLRMANNFSRQVDFCGRWLLMVGRAFRERQHWGPA